jgi:hypothetical protein
MREINQGVVYDKQGRGRRTLGDGGPDGERLIFYNQSRTLTPRKEQEDPYHETTGLTLQQLDPRNARAYE